MGTPATASCNQSAEKKLLCDMICRCQRLYENNPTLKIKRQICVDAQTEIYNRITKDSNIYPEAPYYVDPNNETAVPLLQNKSQVIGWSRQIYMSRLAATSSDDWDVSKIPLMMSYADGEINARDINKLRASQGQPPLASYKDLVPDEMKAIGGGLRKPDITVLNNPDGDFTSDNIKNIYEIKFPPDDWGQGQERAYSIIAGDRSKVEQLGPDECACADQNGETETSKATATAPLLSDAALIRSAAGVSLEEPLQPALNPVEVLAGGFAGAALAPVKAGATYGGKKLLEGVLGRLVPTP